MIVKSSNLSGSSLIVIEETCTYTQDKQDEQKTHYKQDAKITAFLPCFSSKFEHFSAQSISSKSREGMKVVEQLCQKIQRDGVLSLFPAWNDVVAHSNSLAAAASR
jgi:hypothetical protein